MAPEYESGYGRRRMGPGRRRGRRKMESLPGANLFGPLNVPAASIDFIDMGAEHVEALRLCDILGLTQQEAAERLGVSRRTLWSDLKEAGAKVARALMEGRGIRIVGPVPD
jgi:hypothetical protein